MSGGGLKAGHRAKTRAGWALRESGHQGMLPEGRPRTNTAEGPGAEGPARLQGCH